MEKRTISIGVVGCGTVGAEVIKSLARKRKSLKEKTGLDLAVSKVYDKDTKKRSLFPSLFTSNLKDITESSDIDIVVELIGGTDAAFEVIKKALKNGKSVVTANKAVISDKGKMLFPL
ncbi:MAG: homoserine dehydrogenase, partial [Elusimicrobia bacterium]|nr:homoserine dehydrogenase [Elusimicrobiota bacterium]